MTMLNVRNLATARREYPNWNARGRIKKVDGEGNIMEGQYAFGGEMVRVSPRYQKNGTNFRVRPERPAAFFAAWAFENDLLPTPLTPEEAHSQAGLELLEPLWEAYRDNFTKLESPFAACDQATEPNLRVGFSFNIYQVLVEQTGIVKHTNGISGPRSPVARANIPSMLEGLKRKVDEMRARNTSSTENERPVAGPAKAKK